MLQDKLTVYIQSNIITDTIELHTIDILLDETLLYGKIYVPKACLATTGSTNRRLPAKQPYELVLRLAEHFSIILSGEVPTPDTSGFLIFDFDETVSDKDAMLTDCYIISRYKKMLLEHNMFDAAVESLILAADMTDCKNEILEILPEMLSERGLYLHYFLGSAPFLIYTGDTTCYNILSVFAKELGNTLIRNGHLVEYFDLSVHNPSDSVNLVGRRFQAIIGMQSYMFSIRLENNIDFLHDRIIGPKYNFVFDHPIRFERHLYQTPDNFTILTPDRNYAVFARDYYSVNAHFLPPAGIPSPFQNTLQNYDVTFIASFDNFTLERLKEVHALPRNERFLINHVWKLIRQKPILTIETALQLVLSDTGLSKDEFFSIYHKLRSHLFLISDYYRYQVLKTLLDAGIQVDVFGTSWISSNLRNHPCFIWHNKDLTTEECLDVWQHSKLALNVMSWHKDAITERILNSMLQKAVVITERNPYICEEFIENEDLILYDLDKLDLLPKQVRSLLSDTTYCSAIAENGYKKALASHTWDNRATQLLTIIDSTERL